MSTSVIRSKCRSLGFTVVEVIVGTAIVSLLFGLVFFMYSKANTVTTKGIWRVAAINQLRLGLREISRILTNASYPALATAQVVEEAQTDSFGLIVFSKNANSEELLGVMKIVSFSGLKSSNQPVLSVWNCRPVTDGNLTSSTDARAEKYTVLFSGSSSAPAIAPNNRDLILRKEIGTYSMSASGEGPPSATTKLGNPIDKVIIRDVDAVRLSMPMVDANAGGMISVTVTLRDNVDGKLTMADGISVEKNVKVARQ
jgi:hypothetical protein